VEEEKGGRGRWKRRRRRRRRQQGLVGRAAIRHYGLSPMPAGQNALALQDMHRM